MKKIGVLTSGGDAPGMNAAIRAVVRTCIYNKITPIGIYEGYKGLLENQMKEFSSRNVSNIIQRGGTVLKSARCSQFLTKEGRLQGYKNIQANKIDGLIVIGGDGTFAGAKVFFEEFGVPIVGIPGTIDNDLYGTDFCIGYDSALNTIVEAVDKIRDTASSHNRLFIIEVMGRDAGFLALRSGIGVGAEAILIPETPVYTEKLIKKLKDQSTQNKQSMIVIVAEGEKSGGAHAVAEHVKSNCPEFDVKVSILGHIQRGGSPSALDRVLASRLGNAAVDALKKGSKNEMIGILHREISHIPFEKAIKHNVNINPALLKLSEILAI